MKWFFLRNASVLRQFVQKLIPITFPIEAIPEAPVSAMIFAIIASTSASESCAGRNFSITAICANSGSAKSGRFCVVKMVSAVFSHFYQFL